MIRSRTATEQDGPRWTAAVIVAATLLLGGGAARADDRKAEAESLFTEGRTLAAQGSWEAACPKFAESYRLEAGLGTLLNLASCQEQLGRTASAWASFREALALAQRTADRRAAFARKHADALEKKLSRLAIVVPAEVAVPGLEILRDGVAVGPASWGSAIAIDPGEHAVEARAPGHASFSATVKVGPAADVVTLKIPPLAPEAAAGAPPSPAPVARRAPAAAPHEPPAPARASALGPIVGASAIGIGAGALVASVVAGLLAMRKDGKAADHCPTDTTCDREGLGASESAHDLAAVATVAGAAGVVLVLAGVSTFLFWPRAAQRARLERFPVLTF
jgi:serine/threonine-protein kinase